MVPTLWIPAGDPPRLRARYREALSTLGWHAGPWRLRAVSEVHDGPTHVCLPTLAGVFLLPPESLRPLDPLALALSECIAEPLLCLDEAGVWVASRGAVRAREDLASLAAALDVPVEVVRQLLDASRDATTSGAAGGHAAEVWELVALRVC